MATKEGDELKRGWYYKDTLVKLCLNQTLII